VIVSLKGPTLRVSNFETSATGPPPQSKFESGGEGISTKLYSHQELWKTTLNHTQNKVMNTIAARHAPVLGFAGCKNIFKEPKSFYTPKKVRKSLEGLAGCQNIFKEPKSFYTPKKVRKSLEGLAGCQNIFKEPKSFYTAKKVRKPLEGLAGCKNIFKEPRVTRVPKSRKTCSQCGGIGHNKRTCKVIACPPCVILTDTPTMVIREKRTVLLTRSSSAP